MNHELRTILSRRPLIQEIRGRRVDGLANAVAYAISFASLSDLLIIGCNDVDDSICVRVGTSESLEAFLREEIPTSLMAGSHVAGMAWTQNLQGYLDGLILVVEGEGGSRLSCQFEAGASMVDLCLWRALEVKGVHRT